MNQLQKVFNYGNLEVRTVIKNGELWFVAKDICEILEIKNHSDAVSRLNNKQKSVLGIADPHGRMQDTAVINESGVYKLVFRSNKPEAERFTDWIVEDVLPSIRKYGTYDIQKPQSQAQLLLMYAEQFVEMEKRVNQVETAITTIKETIIQRDEDWRKSINTMFNSAVIHSDSKDFRSLRNESYTLLEERARCNLNQRLRNLLDRLEQSGATKTQINNTSKMGVIENDPRLKEIYTAIVKEISIRYVPVGVS